MTVVLPEPAVKDKEKSYSRALPELSWEEKEFSAPPPPRKAK